MCSRNISFKCCKSKPFIHYVCIDCAKNEIICCDNEKNLETKEQVSNLEETIDELSTDGIMKDNFIEKLRKDNEIFMKDALEQEEESSYLIDRLNKSIDDMEHDIECLQQKLDEEVKYTSSNISTQTSNVRTKN
ncbi:hypothetical protein JTB14_012885 [Gonioctena quinquepunctata]|nr:hypothetical protein JTB14_012885 [Gonioctena quinquepunctata]